MSREKHIPYGFHCAPRGALLVACVCAVASGCHTLRKPPTTNYRTVAGNPNRDTAAAKKLHQGALRILGHCNACYECECLEQELCDLGKAEELLQRALVADVRYGPAHNTLGDVYFRQRKLYLAAWEFEYAVGLMPERGEPLNNLGLVYEEARRLGRAIEHYQEAVELEPTNAEYVGNLARASLRQGTPLEEVEYLLRDLLLYDSRPSWVGWASDLLGTNPANPEIVAVDYVGEPLDTGDDADESEIDPEELAIPPSILGAETLPAPVLVSPEGPDIADSLIQP